MKMDQFLFDQLGPFGVTDRKVVRPKLFEGNLILPPGRL